MSRPLRIEIPDGVYHVTARGNARSEVFRGADDRRTFLGVLDKTVSRFGWHVLAYCLMGNHYHLLAETPAPNLARGMRQLNGVYAQRFNRRHERSGHLFEGRYAAVLVQRDAHLLAALRYIAHNPVEAGLCSHPLQWLWSSHAAVAGLRSSPIVAVERVHALFGGSPAVARARYRAFVEDPDTVVSPPTGSDVIAGSRAFAAHHLAGKRRDGELPKRHWHAGRPPLEEILGDGSVESLATAYRHHGYTMRQIADALRCHPATVSRRLRAWEGRRVFDCKT